MDRVGDIADLRGSRFLWTRKNERTYRRTCVLSPTTRREEGEGEKRGGGGGRGSPNPVNYCCLLVCGGVLLAAAVAFCFRKKLVRDSRVVK